MSRKRKQSKNRTEVKEPQQPLTSWITLATEDQPKLAVPIGPRFQADLPLYTGPSRDHNGLIAQKLLIEQTWSVQNNISFKEGNNKRKRLSNGFKTCGIGEGRFETCSCPSPGTVKCIEYHVNEERMKLKTELGPAYQKWKFHEMGNVVSESWTKQDQQTFDSLVKENRISQGDGFMKPALKSLTSKSRASIVSYYLNVYVPRRISCQTRSGCREIDTDDEEEDSKTVNPKSSKAKTPAKMEIKSSRSRSYLSGRR